MVEDGIVSRVWVCIVEVRVCVRVEGEGHVWRDCHWEDVVFFEDVLDGYDGDKVVEVHVLDLEVFYVIFDVEGLGLRRAEQRLGVVGYRIHHI